MLTVQATLIAGTASLAYVELFNQLTQEMSGDSQARDQIAGTMSGIRGPIEEQVAWAKQASSTMFLTMVQHPLMEGAMSKGKDMMRTLQEKLSRPGTGGRTAARVLPSDENGSRTGLVRPIRAS